MLVQRNYHEAATSTERDPENENYISRAKATNSRLVRLESSPPHFDLLYIRRSPLGPEDLLHEDAPEVLFIYTAVYTVYTACKRYSMGSYVYRFVV